MKMNIKEKKEQITNWVKENKFNVLLGIGGIITVVILATGVKKAVTEVGIEDELYLEPYEKEFDPGRELEMQFVVPETGEILGTIGVMESYMKDMLDCQ